VRREYFEDMYAASADPWSFATRWYEQRKYALTLAALTRPRYRSAFEPGCSVGVLTGLLARRCDRLLAADLVDVAVQQARTRVRSLGTVGEAVEVRQWDAAHDLWPDGPFDLVVVSEMLYYLDPDTAERFVKNAVTRLDPDGELLLVHWRPTVPEYPMTGDEAHEVARRVSGLGVAAHYEDEDLVLDLLSRSSVPGVARREGLR
jgi:SAM-dependent methyltransferase